LKNMLLLVLPFDLFVRFETGMRKKSLAIEFSHSSRL
jgi:hypothetical protein